MDLLGMHVDLLGSLRVLLRVRMTLLGMLVTMLRVRVTLLRVRRVGLMMNGRLAAQMSSWFYISDKFCQDKFRREFFRLVTATTSLGGYFCDRYTSRSNPKNNLTKYSLPRPYILRWLLNKRATTGK
jgi:hypothetical protein